MYLSLSIEHEVLNLDSAWTRSCYRRETCKYRLGFAAALAILITGASQSRQHVDISLIHIESRNLPTAELFDVDSGRISIVTVNTKEYHSDVLAIIIGIMRRTLDNSL
ncbi:hypothetical protein Tco_0341046 [Tanacetum coccineum]